MHQLLYCLNILLKLSREDQEWARKFSKADGTQFLLQIFLKPKEEFKGGKLLVMKEESMIILLNQLLTYESDIGDLNIFLRSIFESFNLIMTSSVNPGQIEDPDSLFKSLKNLINLIHSKSQTILRSYLLETPETLQNLLSGCLILSEDPVFSANANFLLDDLFEITSTYSEVFLVLNEMLEKAITKGKRSNEYWDLLSKVVNYLDSEKEKMTSLAERLINEIMTHEGEKNCNEKDFILLGMIKVLTKIWKKTDVIPNEEHMNLFLTKCLFEVPDKIDRAGITPPKCKHVDTRNQTFDLLLELCQISQSFCQSITQDLGRFHEEPN